MRKISLKIWHLSLAIGVGLSGSSLLAMETEFPYSRPSSEIKVKIKDYTDLRLHYLITAGNVTGDAVLASVPSEDAAKSAINLEIVGVRSTFDDRPAPYPGHITSTLSCETKKHVKEKKVLFLGKEALMIFAVASDRRIFGICSTSEVKYAALVWSAYDSKRAQVVTVKLFRPIDNTKDIEKSQQEVLEVFKKVISQGGT